jgi:hypothetical protein
MKQSDKISLRLPLIAMLGQKDWKATAPKKYIFNEVFFCRQTLLSATLRIIIS